MLSVETIDVFYGDAQALDGVSLEVEQGAIVAIVGANGAGKTSLIRTIAGMNRPARGAIRYRVHGDCESPSAMTQATWFVLPPAEEYYYRKAHAEYRVSDVI